jgi:hypothetical protein
MIQACLRDWKKDRYRILIRSGDLKERQSQDFSDIRTVETPACLTG